MTSVQYEELCRFFVSDQLGIPLDQVKSVRAASAVRPGLKPYKNQIDLVWEFDDALGRYLSIANAKWRGTAKVDQGEILLLDKVRQEIGAQKAIMITNCGFTDGATSAAAQHCVGLHIVAPEFASSALPKNDRPAISTAISRIAAEARPYGHEVIQKSDTLASSRPAAGGAPGGQSQLGQSGSSPTASASFNTRLGGGVTRSGGELGQHKSGGGETGGAIKK
jgi:hypothetical protein